MGTERQKFWAALRSPLPVCVRINKSMAGWRLLAQRISRLGGWTPLAWVPDELAWTVRCICAWALLEDGSLPTCGYVPCRDSLM